MSSDERYKGHDPLLDLWSAVLSDFSEARLVIAGDGDDRGRLEAKARDLGLAHRVTFAGRVSDDELRRLYRDCAFFVMPSSGEGFGLVFLEAMRAAKACIGGLGAASEIIEDGVTGLVVDPADTTAVSSAIVRLFRDPGLATSMGQAGRHRVAEHFTADHFRARLRAILETADTAN
jgi:phosphatidyl-myo-inositol dimannoside synthase